MTKNFCSQRLTHFRIFGGTENVSIFGRRLYERQHFKSAQVNGSKNPFGGPWVWTVTVRRSKCWKVDQWNSRWWSRKFLNSKVVARNFFVSLRAFEWYQNYKIWPRKPPWNIIRSWLHHLMRRIIKFVFLEKFTLWIFIYPG